jgi:hypothetical protein
MIQPVDTKDRRAVENEVSSHAKNFPQRSRVCFQGFWLGCGQFQGRYEIIRRLTPVIMIWSTLQGTLHGLFAFSVSVGARLSSESEDVRTRFARHLLHDTGYLSSTYDDGGGQIHLVHVDRSADCEGT